MAFKIVMPRLGWSMETGRFLEWLKPDGEYIEVGDILFTVESDKAIQEVEALESGILRILPDSPPPGEELPVGTVLAYLVQHGETAPFENGPPFPGTFEQTATMNVGQAPSPVADQVTAEADYPAADSGSEPPEKVERPTTGEPKISPRAQRMAVELGIDWTIVKGSGRGGRIVVRDVRRAAQEKEEENQLKAPPVARHLAKTAGIDLAEGEKIVHEDAESAVAAREEPSKLRRSPEAGDKAGPITQVRRIIAQRMAESAHTTASVTLTTEADATQLVNLREQLKTTFDSRDMVVPTYTDLIIKLTSMALQEYPMLNAYWEEEKLIIPSGIHIAVAIDTEAGLLVPVIRDVSGKSIQQIAEEARSVREKALTRQVSPDDMRGGTFTISNLGMYGIDAFTPIINLPQCAILGVGRIISKPAVYNNEIVPRMMMILSLTFDHRVVDGGPAARFLNAIRKYVEQPYLWLTR